MGVRVTKAVGYGLTDVIMDGSRIDDPRFHSERWKKCREQSYELEDADQQLFLEERRDKLIAAFSEVNNIKDSEHAACQYTLEVECAFQDIERARERGYYCEPRSVIGDSEFGIPGVVLFIPLNRGAWHRYNDTLDWIEETASHNQANRLVFLKRPPYPNDQWTSDNGRVTRHLFPREEKPQGYRPLIPMSLFATLFLFEDGIVDIVALARQLSPLLYVTWG
jgi:hypothetical protein